MTSSSHQHSGYLSVCEKAAIDDFVFNNFKRDPYFNLILEHVSYQQGLGYIKEFFNKDVDYSIFADNDKFGNPIKHDFTIGSFSPTTLRYIKVAYDILNLFQGQNIKTIVEIGCGYGGQFTVLDKLVPLDKYYLIDLPEVTKLINTYLSKLRIVSSFETVNALNNEKIKQIPPTDLVISNYAFSECIHPVRKLYLETIIKNSKCGYMTINYLDPTERAELYSTIQSYGKETLIIPEIPLTGSGNEILIWKSSELV